MFIYFILTLAVVVIAVAFLSLRAVFSKDETPLRTCAHGIGEKDACQVCGSRSAETCRIDPAEKDTAVRIQQDDGDHKKRI